VRAIPYVAPSGIGAHEIVRFLEGDEYGRFRGVFAYQVQADSAPSRVAPIEWKRVAISLRAFDEIITGREARGDMTKNVGLNQWKKKSIRRIPAGVFVWKDEFTSAHLQAFIQGQVTEQEFKRGDHDPIFQPLIYPPKMRKIVMEGFEGLPLAAIAAPVVSSEPARTTHDGDDDDDDDDSTWDELEPSLYLDKMGAEVLASLYPRGKPTVRLSDERSVALARSPFLEAADWIELTGVNSGEYSLCLVGQSGVRFIGFDNDTITLSPRSWQPFMLRDNDTPPLSFPCTPKELLLFVDTLHAGVHAFSVPDAFRQAVAATENAQATATTPQAPDESLEQAILSAATEDTALPVTPADDTEQADRQDPAEAAHSGEPERGSQRTTTQRRNRSSKVRALLQLLIDDGVHADIDSIWLHIMRNRGKEGFPFATASATTATDDDGKRYQKAGLSRALGRMLKAMKTDKDI